MSEFDYLIEPCLSGETEWILKQFPEGYVGTAVELGALNGIYLSTTYLLEQAGWRCLAIEPNPLWWGSLIQNRRLPMCCSCWKEAIMGARVENDGVWRDTKSTTYWDEPGPGLVLTLDQCLQLAGFAQLDVLSLDVDGPEMDILDGFTFERWKPKALVIEVTGGGERERPVVLPPNYRQVGMIADNALFLREDA